MRSFFERHFIDRFTYTGAYLKAEGLSFKSFFSPKNPLFAGGNVGSLKMVGEYVAHRLKTEASVTTFANKGVEIRDEILNRGYVETKDMTDVWSAVIVASGNTGYESVTKGLAEAANEIQAAWKSTQQFCSEQYNHAWQRLGISSNADDKQQKVVGFRALTPKEQREFKKEAAKLKKKQAHRRAQRKESTDRVRAKLDNENGYSAPQPISPRNLVGAPVTNRAQDLQNNANQPQRQKAVSTLSIEEQTASLSQSADRFRATKTRKKRNFFRSFRSKKRDTPEKTPTKRNTRNKP